MKRWRLIVAGPAAVMLLGTGLALLPAEQKSAAVPEQPPAAAPVPPPTDHPEPADHRPERVSFGPERERMNEELVVRDGDRVEVVRGRIIAVPGEPVRLCGDVLPMVYGAQWERCGGGRLAVTLVGVELDKLQGRDISPGPAKVRRAAPKGTVFGHAHLAGRWRNRTVMVEQQRPILPTVAQLDRVPCPPPAGGWQPGEPTPPKALLDYVKARPDQLGIWTAWPQGAPETSSSRAPGVVMIGVAHADLAPVRAVARKLYQGNLCVLPIPLSPRETQVISDRVAALPFGELGIQGSGTGASDGLPWVRLTVLDEPAAAALRPIGLGYLDIDPYIRPTP